jgi:hypothetical protein
MFTFAEEDAMMREPSLPFDDPPWSPAAAAAPRLVTKETPMIQMTPTPTQMSPATVPIRLAADYLRRYAEHVVVTANPESVTLSFGQVCPENPQNPVVEMYASLTMSRSFAQQVLTLLQQQLQAAPLAAPKP